MRKRLQLIRKKWRRFFAIPIILLCLLIPSVYVNSLAGYMGAVFFLSLLLLSFLSMQYIKRNISVAGAATERSCLRGEKLPVGIYLMNHSFLVAPKIRTSFFWRNTLQGRYSRKTFTMSLGSDKKNRMTFRPKFDHVGVYHIGLTDTRLYDMLGFFSIKLPIDKEFKVIVRPRTYLPEREINDMVAADVEQENGILLPGGMDYMGIREYQWGDPMKQIHWKLSARRSEYVTRLTEAPRRCTHTILMDLSAPQAWKKYWLDLNDTLIEFSLSLLEWMDQQGEDYHFLYASKDHLPVRILPLKEELPDLFLSFDAMSSPDSSGHCNGRMLLEQEDSEGFLSSNLIFCTAALTDEVISILTDFRQLGKSVEVYLALPKQTGEKEMEHISSQISQMAEYNILCQLITTQRNEDILLSS